MESEDLLPLVNASRVDLGHNRAGNRWEIASRWKGSRLLLMTDFSWQRACKSPARLLQAWRRRKIELMCEGLLGATVLEQVAGPDQCPAGVLGHTLTLVVQGGRHNEPAVTVLLNIPSRLPLYLSVFDKYKQTQEVTRALLRLVLI